MERERAAGPGAVSVDPGRIPVGGKGEVLEGALEIPAGAPGLYAGGVAQRGDAVVP